MDTFSAITWLINRGVPTYLVIAVLIYIGDNENGRHTYVEGLDHFARTGGLATSLAILLAYLFLCLAVRRWNAFRLKSRLKISSPTTFDQFTLRSAGSDPVAVASLYVAIAILLATLATLLR
jgi:hypothetical protein